MIMIICSSPSLAVLFSVPAATATVVVFDSSGGVVWGSGGMVVGGGRLPALQIVL